MLKVLTQYQEATGDPRVIPLMQRYFAYLAAQLDDVPLVRWAVYRWADQVLSILWLYNRTGDAELLELAPRAARSRATTGRGTSPTSASRARSAKKQTPTSPPTW